jgi:hypothetical protein
VRPLTDAAPPQNARIVNGDRNNLNQAQATTPPVSTTTAHSHAHLSAPTIS